VWLIILSDQLSIAALVSSYPTNQLIEREPVHQRVAAFLGSSGEPSVCGLNQRFRRVSPTGGLVTHVLLTRPPLTDSEESARTTCMCYARRQRLS
jgi:hypothetical protein